MNGIPGLYLKQLRGIINNGGGNKMGSLSINSEKTMLFPIIGSKSYIEIKNNTGEINFDMVGTNVTVQEIDKILESLTLAKQISNAIKN